MSDDFLYRVEAQRLSNKTHKLERARILAGFLAAAAFLAATVAVVYARDNMRMRAELEGIRLERERRQADFSRAIVIEPVYPGKAKRKYLTKTEGTWLFERSWWSTSRI
jgi:hypothetical protein